AAPATTALRPLSLHDALPICAQRRGRTAAGASARSQRGGEGKAEAPVAQALHASGALGTPEQAQGQGSAPLIDLRPRFAGACHLDRKSTRLNSSHVKISYAVF